MEIAAIEDDLRARATTSKFVASRIEGWFLAQDMIKSLRKRNTQIK
jgi:hypothetical protein